jgi:hypothetical protein
MTATRGDVEMTGPEHYREAESILEALADLRIEWTPEARQAAEARAAVHSQLANTAAIMHGHLVGSSIEEVRSTPAAQEWIHALAPPVRTTKREAQR